MFKDQMTPKERMTAFAKGEPMDRIPLVPDMGVTMAGFIGASCYDYYHDAKVLAETEIRLFRRLRHDSVGVSTTLRGMAEAMGSKIDYPRDNISLLAEPVVKREEDIAGLPLIKGDREGKLPLLLEALERIRDAIGQEADIGASMTAPFSVAASVLGTETLLRWMVKKPEAVHRTMEIITANNRSYIKALAQRGFTTGFCDPVSSMSLIKPDQFREFSLPYLKKNLADCQELMNSKPTLHICGKSRAIWEDLRESGMGNFSIDNCEDLAEAKAVVGDVSTITGNVPPVDVVLLGNAATIEESVKACIAKAWDSPKGFILSTGCQIPKGTPIENIEAFMEAGRKYGSYPIRVAE